MVSCISHDHHLVLILFPDVVFIVATLAILYIVRVKRKDRVCKECSSVEVEDVTHWLLRCPAWSSHRQPLLAFAQSHTENQEGTVYLLSCACRNYNILSIIMSMWHACFRKH